MKKAIKLRLIICSIVLFTVAVGINVLLNSSSVDRLYEDSTISQYGAIGDYLKATLTGTLKSGQKIDEIRNIQQILAKTEASLKQVGFDQTKVSSTLSISRYVAILENLKTKLINLFFSVFKILGI